MELSACTLTICCRSLSSIYENRDGHWVIKNKYKSDIEFTYNEQGFVTERKEMPYAYELVSDAYEIWEQTGDIWKDLYIYTAAQVTPTEIDEVKNHDEGFTRNGREIRTAEGAAVTVYDLSGRQVAAGTGHLTLPNSGIFLINCNGKTTKVSCR